MWWWNWNNVKSDCHHMFANFSDDLIYNNRIIYQTLPHFKNYKNKSVLIIGGGGSTNDMNWKDLKNYDYIWSVNHFYKHPILKDTKIDLVMMMAEPDITNKEWLAYRNKYKPMVGFEVHDKWKSWSFDNYDKYFCMHTKYYSMLGACTRMIIFACELGASKVHFVGLDGIGAIHRGDHAFEPGKTTLPGMEGSFGDGYFLFWNYVMQSYPLARFKNLGGGEKYHETVMRHHSS